LLANIEKIGNGMKNRRPFIKELISFIKDQSTAITNFASSGNNPDLAKNKERAASKQ
jgi:hypothetical protein